MHSGGTQQALKSRSWPIGRALSPGAFPPSSELLIFPPTETINNDKHFVSWRTARMLEDDRRIDPDGQPFLPACKAMGETPALGAIRCHPMLRPAAVRQLADFALSGRTSSAFLLGFRGFSAPTREG